MIGSATPKATSTLWPQQAAAVLRRFVWKEYRMVRGLWLAVLVMGLVCQAAALAFVPHASYVQSYFAIGLAAAVLYAAGVAAMTFSVEHEEKTHEFLLGLPTAWNPIFAGKVFVAAASTAMLAGSLVFSGWALAGGRVPGGGNAATAMGIFGVGMVEALAWGTFLSLVTKRPLVAALLTLVLGGLAVNVAVSVGSSYPAASTNPAAYSEAAPLRLLLAGVLFAVSGLVAGRWLTVGGEAKSRANAIASARLRMVFRFDAAAGRAALPMLARLLWQTLRESWRLLLIPIGVVAFLVSSIAAVVGLGGAGESLISVVLGVTLLFLPVLYGSLAFSADQRHANYRFLAGHAARPRWIWLARNIVWLGAVAVLVLGLQLALAAVGAYGLSQIAEHSRDVVSARYWGSNVRDISHQQLYQQLGWAAFLANYVGLTLLGWLTAYSLGQVCSMVIRSEVLAVFIGVVLAAVLSAWVAVLWLWHLSGWLFLLPFAIGFFLSTWLRAPDWLVERSTWRAWVRPIGAIVVPVAFVALLLSPMRLGQIEMTVRFDGKTRPLDTAFAAASQTFRAGDTRVARQTAEHYIQAAELLAADRAAVKRAVAAAMELSERPACRFNVNLGLTVRQRTTELADYSLTAHPLYQKLVGLQSVVLANDSSILRDFFWSHYAAREFGYEYPDDFFPRALAALRMSRHYRSGQPSAVFVDQLRIENNILQVIFGWIGEPTRSPKELQNAREELHQYFSEKPSLSDALFADDRLVREVLTGRQPPLSLVVYPDSVPVYLALAANELPWERARALRALDRITLYNVRDAEIFKSHLQSPGERSAYSAMLRQWVRPNTWYWESLPGKWQIVEYAAATSYLARYEYQTRVSVSEICRAYCDNQVFREAARLHIALASYRHDHGEYPRRLAELVPRYVDELPRDPYSGQPFGYSPDGLELPLVRKGAVTNFERIEPNTPLFWSVGLSQAQLMQRVDERWTESETESPDDRRVVSEDVYVLSGADYPYWDDSTFLFSLPK